MGKMAHEALRAKGKYSGIKIKCFAVDWAKKGENIKTWHSCKCSVGLKTKCLECEQKKILLIAFNLKSGMNIYSVFILIRLLSLK